MQLCYGKENLHAVSIRTTCGEHVKESQTGTVLKSLRALKCTQVVTFYSPENSKVCHACRDLNMYAPTNEEISELDLSDSDDIKANSLYSSDRWDIF